MGKAVLVIWLVALGLGGLYLKVEYAGWVLFVGLLAAFG